MFITYYFLAHTFNSFFVIMKMFIFCAKKNSMRLYKIIIVESWDAQGVQIKTHDWKSYIGIYFWSLKFFGREIDTSASVEYGLELVK